jgi:hypothetical protein
VYAQFLQEVFDIPGRSLRGFAGTFRDRFTLSFGFLIFHGSSLMTTPKLEIRNHLGRSYAVL